MKPPQLCHIASRGVNKGIGGIRQNLAQLSLSYKYLNTL